MSDLDITISAVVDGFPVTIAFTGTIEQLPAVVKRLRSLGASEPVSRGGFTRKPKAPRVAPAYSGNGDPICPKHNKPLREGRFGLFCPAKDDSTERGYCNLKFAEA